MVHLQSLRSRVKFTDRFFDYLFEITALRLLLLLILLLEVVVVILVFAILGVVYIQLIKDCIGNF